MAGTWGYLLSAVRATAGVVLFSALLAVVAFISSAPNVSAEVPAPKQDNCHKSLMGIPTWYEYLNIGDDGKGDTCAILPFPGDTEFDWGKALPRVGLAVVNIMLRVAAFVAVGFTIYGGFKYILSQGEPEATKKAKGTIVNASIGLVIAMFSSIIVGFVGGIIWK